MTRMIQTEDGRWVDLNASPEGALKRAQEAYDKCWDDWWSSRSPAGKERLEQAEARLETAKENLAANDAAREAKAQAEKDARQAEEDAALEQELEPIKRREMHARLAANPGRDERDFAQQA